MNFTQKRMFELAIAPCTGRVVVSFLKSEAVAKRLADQLKRGLDKKTLNQVDISAYPDVRWGGLHSVEVRSKTVAVDADSEADANKLRDAAVAVLRKHLKKDDFLTSYEPRRQTN